MTGEMESGGQTERPPDGLGVSADASLDSLTEDPLAPLIPPARPFALLAQRERARPVSLRAMVCLATAVLAATGACAGGSSDEASRSSTTEPTTAPTTTTVPTTTVPPTTTTTLSVDQVRAQERVADLPIIKALYSGYSDSWFKSVDNGVQFMVDHNYPSPRITFARCKKNSFPSGAPKDYREEIVIDEASIERQDGWQVVGGTWGGIVPEGRIYILKALVTRQDAISPPQQTTEQVHVVLRDGQAFFFIDCATT